MQLIKNIRAVFKCIRKAGLERTAKKCRFRVIQVEFLGGTITPGGVAPQDYKIKAFLAKTRFPKSKKQVQKYSRFVNYNRNYIPRLSEKLIGVYEFLNADAKFLISEELVENFKEINSSLVAIASSWKTIRPTKRKLLSNRIRFNDRRKRRKAFAPVAFGSCGFLPVAT